VVNVNPDAVPVTALFDCCSHEAFAEVLRLAVDEVNAGAAG
jgi:hypothetical protein